ncbi:MAG: TetR/AcrR family transcriptional regulator [Puniceicoccaceae bacterium]
MITGDRKTALLDSAQDLIQTVGVNAMSYNDLSLAVGIRKASIHYHFPKKDDLVEALLQRCGNDYGQHYRTVACSEDPVMDKLRAIAQIFENSLMEGKICTVGMLSVESTTLSETIRERLKATINSSVAIIEGIFIQGVSDRTFPRTLDTTLAARAFHDFLLGAQVIARALDDPEHFRTSANEYLRLLG